MRLLSHPLVHKGALLLSSDILSKAISLANQIILINILPIDTYGRYAFALAWCSYFLIPIGGGLDTILAREATLHPDSIPSLARRILRYRLSAATLLFLLGIPVALLIPQIRPYASEILLYSLSFFIFAATLDWWAVGRGRIRLISQMRLLQTSIQIIVTILLVTRLPSALAALAAVLLSLLVPTLLVRRVFHTSETGPEPHPNLATTREILRLALLLSLTVGAASLVHNMDHLMLGLLRGDAELGLYAACYKIVILGMTLPGIFTTLYAQKLAHAFKTGGPDLLPFILKSSLVVLTGVALPLAILNLAPGLCFRLLLLGKITPAPALLLPLSLSCLVLALAFLLSIYLNMLRQEKPVFWVYVVICALNATLNLLWIPAHGAIGSAWATFLAIAVQCPLFLLILIRAWPRQPFSSTIPA